MAASVKSRMEGPSVVLEVWVIREPTHCGLGRRAPSVFQVGIATHLVLTADFLDQPCRSDQTAQPRGGSALSPGAQREGVCVPSTLNIPKVGFVSD
jgi:hypothetical protein